MAHAHATAQDSSATATAEQMSCCSESSAKPMISEGAICHVEFTVPDITKASQFYGDLFGWQFMPFMENEMYFQTPSSTGFAGPCGCILKGTPDTAGKTTIYVNVNDIPAMLDKAIKIGARTIAPKTEIPGGHGFFAKIQTPDGNHFGIYSRN